MSVTVPAENRSILTALYTDCSDSTVRTCLEGAGEAICDRPDRPAGAIVALRDFAFLSAEDEKIGSALLRDFAAAHQGQRWIIIPVQEALVPCFSAVFPPAQCKQQERYSTMPAGRPVSDETLHLYAERLPAGFSITPLTAPLFETLKNADWGASDAMGFFSSFADYDRLAACCVVLYDAQPVCVAGSYSCYSGGIEIEIDTKEAFRRRGLATACAATLILLCRKKGLTPHWDAANLFSLAISEKVGFALKTPYPAFDCTC